MMRARAAVALLALLLGLAPAQAQTPNFNFIAPTAPPGTNNNQLATTAFVQGAVGGVIGNNVTVGTSTVFGGTSLRVLYDNGGVLGEYTNTQLTALINAATATLSGALPAWPNNTTTFFRGDGTYATHNCAALTDAGVFCNGTNAASLTGTIAAARLPAFGSGDVSFAAAGGAGTIAANAVTLAKLATQSANTILGNGTGSSAVPTALPIGTGLTLSGATLNTVAPGGTCTGPRVAKTADYLVANADRFSNFSLGGTTFFTLTLNAASGYDANFSVCIHNSDTGRGKHIAVAGGKDFILWPDQVAVISNDNNAWAVRRPNRWKIPNSYGPITLQSNFTLGTDALNATDCLGTGAAACKTVQGALGLAITEFDFDGNAAGNSSLVIQMAAGVSDTQCVHYSTHGGIPGAQGGLAVTIQGGSGANFSCAVSGIEIYLASTVYVNNVSIASSAGYCLAAHDRAKIYVGGGTQLGPCSSGGMYAENAKIELNGTVNIVANMAYFALAQQQGIITTVGFPVTFLNNATFSGAFVQGDGSGQINFVGTTITVAPFAATGTRCLSAANGLTFSSSGVPNTYWPGTVNCSAFTQGQNL